MLQDLPSPPPPQPPMTPNAPGSPRYPLEGLRLGVTGGTGLLGIPLVKALLARGCTVRVLVRSRSRRSELDALPVETVLGDVANGLGLAGFLRDCQGVFHLAANRSTRRSDWRELWQTNAEGTRQLLNATRQAGTARVLVTSSASVLGFQRDPARRLSESQPGELPPGLPYQESKRLAEALTRDAATQGLSTVIVQPSLVFGGQDRSSITFQLLELARFGRLRAWPSGGINCVSVQDVVEGMCLAFQHGMSGERYVLGDENLSWRALFTRLCALVGARPPHIPIPDTLLNMAGISADTIAKTTGWTLALSRSRALNLTRFQYLDDQLARTRLGYSPGSLQSSLEEVLRWMR